MSIIGLLLMAVSIHQQWLALQRHQRMERLQEYVRKLDSGEMSEAPVKGPASLAMEFPNSVRESVGLQAMAVARAQVMQKYPEEKEMMESFYEEIDKASGMPSKEIMWLQQEVERLLALQ
jgi:hypothetical protein